MDVSRTPEFDELMINPLVCSRTTLELNGIMVSPAGTIDPLNNVIVTDPLCSFTLTNSSEVDVLAMCNDRIIDETLVGAEYTTLPGVVNGTSTNLNVFMGILGAAIRYSLC